MYEKTIGGKRVSVYPAGLPNAPVIYLNAGSGDGAEIWREVGYEGFTLAVIGGLDWEGELSPWACPAAFPGGVGFAGGAGGYLRCLTGEILPAVEGGLDGAPAWRGIVGYSLAGLFGLYAAYEAPLFSRLGCISGSLWYPGLSAFLDARGPGESLTHAYFSLGDREHRTRNPLLKSVRRDTEAVCARLQSLGVDAVFELNPSNHFQHVPARIARGIAWLLDEPPRT